VLWRYTACAVDSKFSNLHVTFDSNSNRDVRFEFESNLEASQVLLFLEYSIPKKIDTGRTFFFQPHLQNVIALSWELKKVIFQLHSTAISMKTANFYSITSTKLMLHDRRLWHFTMFKVTSFSQSCSTICFRDGLHSSSALCMSWSNSGLYRLRGSVCVLWALAVM